MFLLRSQLHLAKKLSSENFTRWFECTSGSRGGPRGQWPPPDPVKDYFFAPLALNKYNFPHFFDSLCMAYYFFNILPIFIVQVHKISKLKVKALLVGLGFTYFNGVRCTCKPQVLLLRAFISCNVTE